jgi:hypothetical protein
MSISFSEVNRNLSAKNILVAAESKYVGHFKIPFKSDPCTVSTLLTKQTLSHPSVKIEGLSPSEELTESLATFVGEQIQHVQFDKLSMA